MPVYICHSTFTLHDSYEIQRKPCVNALLYASLPHILSFIYIYKGNVMFSRPEVGRIRLNSYIQYI